MSPLVLSPLAWSPWGSRASPGPLLGLSWAPLGPLLGAPGPLLGLAWAPPGPSGALGVLLGCSWRLLGLSWAAPGPLLASAGVPWRALGPLSGILGPSFDPLGGSWQPKLTFHGTLQKIRFSMCFVVFVASRGSCDPLLDRFWSLVGPLGALWTALGWLLAGSRRLGTHRTSRTASQAMPEKVI